MDTFIKVVKPSKSNTIFAEDYTNYEKYKNNKDSVIINEGTDDEYLFIPMSALEKFKCVVLSRDDFNYIHRDATSLTDKDLVHIAENIGDALIENLFWECLENWADEYDLPYTDSDDDDEYEFGDDDY